MAACQDRNRTELAACTFGTAAITAIVGAGTLAMFEVLPGMAMFPDWIAKAIL